MKVCVVGGRVAGSLTALNLGERDAEVVVFEEHRDSGFPVSCAGLISEDCYERLRNFGVNAKQNEIKGAFFFSPSGKYVEAIGKSRGVVVERKLMDSQLLRRASKVAEVRMSSKVVGVERGEVTFIVNGREKKESFDVLVGADGVNSVVAKSFGFKRPKIFLAVQILSEFEAIDEKFVELYFGRRYSEGFFAYAVPIEEDLAKIGVVSKTNPMVYLQRLINEHPSVSERIGKGFLELNVGAIPIGLVDFVRENVALIGDSAGMVKPYTGGGIYYTLIGAEVLGKTFPNLKAFEKAYKKRMWKEYYFGEKIRKLYETLKDEDYEELVKIASDLSFEDLHMDKPSSILKFLIKNPKILKVVRFFFP
ncbi:geranylgeranyl reductase [Ferroglobus placidus DSM 10642]|uniref:Geranylgeranyl reductase n=1 Tax=Ferroglobus placidus (strain DSM 10642 / AEDII12DO) TaxID=589924 RepID=D3S0D2_FERPA|nr:NAD(P)/FAD-dependent oxidoreductase [Ferroglobus placidus]ADC66195.1 geranylgeranyl reductase [Ferroglobus placidus DSM 10642]